MFDWIRQSIFERRFFLVYEQGAKAIEQWQSARLRDLVGFTMVNVPMYRDRFAAAKIVPGHIRTLSDLPLIPMLKKDDFFDRPFEEYIDNSRPIHRVSKKTSGTTGRPLTVFPSKARLDRTFNNFTCHRFLLNGFKTPRTLSETRITRIDVDSANKENWQFIHSSEFRSRPLEAVRTIADFDPDVVEAFPSTLVEIARLVASDPHRMGLKPRFVSSYGEMLHPKARTFIGRIFGTEVFDRYGSKECGVVAVECARHNGMHVNSESTIVEVVDEHGFPLHDDTRGKILLTDLQNYIMPIIRYDTGDHGTITRARCACGLETPRIWIEGRYNGYLSFNGQRINHIEFEAFDGFMYTILQYQFTKKSDDDLLLRIVPGPAFNDSSRDEIEKVVREIVGPNVHINVQMVTDIPRTPRGKSQVIVDESITAKAYSIEALD